MDSNVAHGQKEGTYIISWMWEMLLGHPTLAALHTSTGWSAVHPPLLIEVPSLVRGIIVFFFFRPRWTPPATGGAARQAWMLLGG